MSRSPLTISRRITPSARLRALLDERPVVEVSPTVELAWRLSRHGITASGPVDAEALARAHCGLHAARQLTPWVTMHGRDPDASPERLRSALRDRRLLRLRCMRRTLHLVPRDLAAVVHAATLAQRLAPCRLALTRSELPARTWSHLRHAVRSALDGRTLPYRQLERDVLDRSPRRVRAHADATVLARLVIKTLWEEGALVVGDASPSMHHEHRTFALTADAIPDLELHALDTTTAVQRLLAAYLNGYGPVNPRDFAWWSGVTLRDALPAWHVVTDRLVRIRITGRADDGLVSFDHTADALLDCDREPQASDVAHVLAYEDPTLKGYFASRWRYADATHMPNLFNSIGEARASLMLDGRVAAVWHWDRRDGRPRLEPLRRLRAGERQRLRERLDIVTGFLRSEPVGG